MNGADGSAAGSPEPTRPDLPRTWSLGPWQVDAATGELYHRDEPAEIRRLEPRVMDLLVHFARHPRQVLTKDDLLDAVWPDVVVQDVALARAVSTLRRELGDDARRPRWIETVPKRGYRLLIEPVPEAEPPPAEPPAENDTPVSTRSASPAPAPVTSSGLGPRLAGLGLLVLLLAAALWTSRPAKVMVLPLEPLTQDPALRFVAEGLSQDIRDHLAQATDLRIFSGSTSRHYRSREIDVSDIADAEGVTRLLDGSLEELADNRLALRLHWVDTEQDRQIWSYKEELERRDLIVFRDEILARALAALEASLPDSAPPSAPTTSKAPPLAGPSFELYLRARARYRRYNPADNAVAVELFQQAVDRAPGDGSALYLAGLANALALQVANYGGDVDLAAKAQSLAERALRLDSNLAEGHKALGLALSCLSRPRQALRAYQEALDLRPHYDEALHNRAFLEQQLGEWDEAGRWQAGRRSLERPLM